MSATELEFEYDWGLALKVREEFGRIDGMRQLLDFWESGRTLEEAKKKFSAVVFE